MIRVDLDMPIVLQLAVAPSHKSTVLRLPSMHLKQWTIGGAGKGVDIVVRSCLVCASHSDSKQEA